MYICICNAVTDKEIEQAVRMGVDTLPALKAALGVTNNCGQCRDAVVQVLQRESAGPATSVTP